MLFSKLAILVYPKPTAFASNADSVYALKHMYFSTVITLFVTSALFVAVFSQLNRLCRVSHADGAGAGAGGFPVFVFVAPVSTVVLPQLLFTTTLHEESFSDAVLLINPAIDAAN